MKNFYITTPIFYANSIPHIGSAYTMVACDVIARFKRMDGYNVKFLTGTDEHGQKIYKTAIDAKEDVKTFVNKLAQNFIDLTDKMNISNDDFIRTTEDRHKEYAKSFWKLSQKYIYEDTYSGWYCMADEAFYQEDELVCGRAPSGREVEWVEDKCYFFRLSHFQDKLIKFYEKNPNFLAPKSKYNEVMSFLKSGLNDICISRSNVKWGIKTPCGNQVIYVWFEALLNYISALGGHNGTEFDMFFKDCLHVIGKDILRFHAVYWPAFLMAANLPMPNRVFAHGWWTVEGAKMSKSEGNVIDPIDLLNDYKLDEIRYYLVSQVSFGEDGDFSREMLKTKIEKELKNDYGNLVQRVLKFITKNTDGIVGAVDVNGFEKEDKLLFDETEALLDKIRISIDDQKIHEYIKQIFLLIFKSNKYINDKKPWELKTKRPHRMYDIMFLLYYVIYKITLYIMPVIPDSALKILKLMSQENDNFSFNTKMQINVKISDLTEPIF